MQDRPALGAHPQRALARVKTICGMHDALISSRTKLNQQTARLCARPGLATFERQRETLAGRIAEIESLPEYVASQVAMLALLPRRSAPASNASRTWRSRTNSANG